MTSINFNASATSALRTLQSTNASLDATQSRISTGLKIGEAKDNAAYWSISTTLKSDNQALSTVKDALGLGAATVDVAYQGLNSALGVMNEIKSKLVSASQDGVDKVSVQNEIVELQSQLKSIATSSSFSGSNWLSVNSGLADYSGTATLVSGFTRDASGNVSIDTVSIDTSAFALMDGSTTSEGILDAGKAGNSLRGGLDSMNAAALGTASAGKSTAAANFAYVAGSGTGFDKTAETLNLVVTVDTGSVNISLTDSNKFDTLDKLVAQMNQQLGSSATASNVSGALVITSNTTGTASTVDITTATFVGSGATLSTLAGVTNGDTATIGSSTAATTTMAASFGTQPITLDSNDTITMQFAANGQAAKNVVIDRDVVNSVLGGTDGKISTATQYASVISKALTNAGVAGVNVGLAGSQITFTSAVSGTSSSVQIQSIKASKGQSVMDIDVSSASKTDITNYLNALSTAIDKVTAAATTLGSVASRVELQKGFVSTLMDTIDKGVSGLVDADMNEESTKLQALQVKQQLGVQALSIANQSAQNVLSLFRS